MRVFILILAVVYLLWTTAFCLFDLWPLFTHWWPMSLTMAFGSFVAGSSAIGGGGVAFPVFTKLLHISPSDARIFSLMIQSMGMSMAAVFIWAKRVPILKEVLLWASLGGLIGILLGTFVLVIPSPYQKLTFTYIISIFGLVLLYSLRSRQLPVYDRMPSWNSGNRLFLLLIGIVGGIISANVGSGLDIITFIVLTLAFGINEQIGTPTSVVLMAINAVIGAFLHMIVKQDVGQVYEYWSVCVPVVIVGAPLGAYVISKASRTHIIGFLLLLILLEFSTTLLLVEQEFWSYLLGLTLFALFGGAFALMLRYRRRNFSSSEA